MTDDAIGEIIEYVMHNGSQTVFTPPDIMGEDQPVAVAAINELAIDSI
ncbi:hypothetical protein [Psychrobacter sp.]